MKDLEKLEHHLSAIFAIGLASSEHEGKI